MKTKNGNSRGADSFTSQNNISKDSVLDLDELVKSGDITILTKEKAMEIIENELGVKAAKKSGIFANMKRNNEVLVHAQILGNKITRCK
ncbi:hypothetical protein [Paenibacillus oleatilyticus]|uniref:hypothetical protein n=1 Tax=Paenibacillus oleatilyticus TaxID=2594886 RepID=UPI001C1F8E37|nr:hypothetical protein [Paenibacillus oleatilyticus]MBU7314854.1 hypothetical protein [Paenibacillus oleatilyticus]